MAMLEGSIVINSATGAVTTKTGAAGEVFDVLVAGSSFGTLSVDNPPAYAAALNQLAVMARAIAKIIPHIRTNGVVSATVAAAIPVSTAGTAAAQTGATTAPGSATGTIA